MGRLAAVCGGAATLVLCACGGLHGGPAVDRSALATPTSSACPSPSGDGDAMMLAPDGCAATPGPTDTPAPTATPSPTSTPSPTPKPTAAATRAAVPTQLTFSGALNGVMQNPSVVCEQNIPQGNQGYMAVSGTVGGTQQVFTIWSRDRTTPNEVYEGTQPGTIDYGPVYGPNPGIGDFDWSRGATVEVYLPPASGASSQPSPSPTPRPSASAGPLPSATPSPSPSASPTPVPGVEVDGTISCP
jgi:hypothetical protein